MKDVDLERLFRSAARVKEDAPVEMPFAFDTRVIALARKNGNGPALAGLLRRIAVAAVAVIVLAGAGAFFEFNNGDSDVSATSGNEYAIADSVIQDEVAQ